MPRTSTLSLKNHDEIDLKKPRRCQNHAQKSKNISFKTPISRTSTLTLKNDEEIDLKKPRRCQNHDQNSRKRSFKTPMPKTPEVLWARSLRNKA
jgi:hypothetical protein